MKKQLMLHRTLKSPNWATNIWSRLNFIPFDVVDFRHRIYDNTDDFFTGHMLKTNNNDNGCIVILSVWMETIAQIYNRHNSATKIDYTFNKIRDSSIGVGSSQPRISCTWRIGKPYSSPPRIKVKNSICVPLLILYATYQLCITDFLFCR